MVRIVVERKNGHYVSLVAGGHAGYDDHGYDIVCAAVSVLTQTANNAIEGIANVELSTEVDEKIGFLSFSIPLDADFDKVDLIFETILYGIRGIVEAYPDFVDLQIEEVQ